MQREPTLALDSRLLAILRKKGISLTRSWVDGTELHLSLRSSTEDIQVTIVHDEANLEGTEHPLFVPLWFVAKIGTSTEGLVS